MGFLLIYPHHVSPSTRCPYYTPGFREEPGNRAGDFSGIWREASQVSPYCCHCICVGHAILVGVFLIFAFSREIGVRLRSTADRPWWGFRPTLVGIPTDPGGDR